jgi:excisionase family DNA binding protein
MEKELYTVEEAASMLGIHVQSIRNAMATGRIAYHKPVPARIDAEALEAYRRRSQPDGTPRQGRPRKQDACNQSA